MSDPALKCSPEERERIARSLDAIKENLPAYSPEELARMWREEMTRCPSATLPAS